LHHAKYLAPTPLGVKNAFWVVLPLWVVLPKKYRFEQKMVTDEKGQKPWISDGPTLCNHTQAMSLPTTHSVF
jgi:hypothetical protein